MTQKKIFSIIFTFLFIQLFTTFSFTSSDIKIYIITSFKGVLVSDNNGRSWSDCNDGLPENCIPQRIYNASGKMYLTTFSSGLFKFNDDTWENISSSMFKRRSIYEQDAGYRKISAFAADPGNADNIAAATKHSIYRSADGGRSWNEIPMTGIKSLDYITALAIDGDVIFAGTSFDGIYELKGKKFVSAGDGLPGEKYSEKKTYPEQVSVLAVHEKRLYAGFYFGGGLYCREANGKTFKPVYIPSDSSVDSVIYDLQFTDSFIFTDRQHLFMKKKDSIDELQNYNEAMQRLTSRKDVLSATFTDENGSSPSLTFKICNPEKKASMDAARNKNAIYVSIPSLKKNLDKLIEITKKTEINAFVIDMKDDFGNIYFTASSPVAAEIKSQKNTLKISGILTKLKENNIYVIARIVTFKDEKLHNAYNNRYAIKNKKTGKAWKGVDTEYWVDPFSDFVHDYNIGLASDLEKAGFDEIQFDYIRFPSDGQTANCDFTYKKDPETYKSEILIDFLKKAKKCLTIPVSVDIYGFNSWYYVGNWIGQDMEELSHVVDVICPMVYPSHFGSRFYNDVSRDIRPYNIVYDGARRALQLIDTSSCIRPYLQAFNLLSPTWGPDYIMKQVNASKESGCSGYTLWNANGDYSVPYKALKKQ